MKVIVFDIESSGLPPKNAQYDTNFLDFPRIVSISWKVDDEETKYFIINQEGFVIPDEAIAIHGITNEMCEASKYHLSGVLQMFKMDAVGADLIVGHNIYFDTSVIKANILRMIHVGVWDKSLFDVFTNLLHKDKRIDTMRKSTKYCALPNNKWPKLTELHEKLFNCSFDAHCSRDDVEATKKCFDELVKLGIIKIDGDSSNEEVNKC